jgi:hypothetical protein
MLPSLTALETNLSQIRKRLEKLSTFEERYFEW